MKKIIGISARLVLIIFMLCCLVACKDKTKDKDENEGIINMILEENNKMIEFDGKENISYDELISFMNKNDLDVSIAYLGNSNDTYKFIKSDEYKKYQIKYNFLKDFSKDRLINLSGDEIYLVVPKNDEYNVRVVEIPTDGTSNIISEKTFESSKPFIIKCNQSDIISNSLIELTKDKEDKISLSPALSLKDGRLLVNKEDKINDITIYDEIDIMNLNDVE